MLRIDPEARTAEMLGPEMDGDDKSEGVNVIGTSWEQLVVVVDEGDTQLKEFKIASSTRDGVRERMTQIML